MKWERRHKFLMERLESLECIGVYSYRLKTLTGNTYDGTTVENVVDKAMKGESKQKLRVFVVEPFGDGVSKVPFAVTDEKGNVAAYVLRENDAQAIADALADPDTLKTRGKVLALLDKLREKAWKHWGSCATGLNDYQHRHASASNCSACGERSEAERMVAALEEALGLDRKDAPCFLTDDKGWCVPHRRVPEKCK